MIAVIFIDVRLSFKTNSLGGTFFFCFSKCLSHVVCHKYTKVGCEHEKISFFGLPFEAIDFSAF